MADEMTVFYEIHQNIPREGPGNADCTRRAFASLPDLPDAASILDIGCGPGMQTLELASLTRGTVVALDNHRPYLESLARRASLRTNGGQIAVIQADMSRPCFVEGSFDLI